MLSWQNEEMILGLLLTSPLNHSYHIFPLDSIYKQVVHFHVRDSEVNNQL